MKTWDLNNIERKREIVRQANARYRQRNPERVLNSSLKHRFGITLTQYHEMLELQHGVCAACGGDEPSGRMFDVDHDHACCPGKRACGKCIRGLLCSRCNKILGHAKDDSNVLIGCMNYLQRSA